ncbi:DUF882 domain-containing protein [Ensifer adhaerens]|uniref:DUF882 domain-containing protein n=1 Tax=Ensifer adhaerens TaxID=106592 RepID=UPI003CD03C0E
MSEYPVTAYPAPVSRGVASNGVQRIARWFGRVTAIAAIAASTMAFTTTASSAEVRSLKLFFTHTGERATITFKRDGKYDPKGLAQINRFLRDWRRNEPARMDPRLLDLVWEVYQRAGAKDYINIVSAYRSPATNNMLRGRSRSTGVAKNSQHMLGKAMDFYIPGVKLTRLREIAMQMQVGGVGYYPTSGSPFVHLDVGNVRAWPRMSRQELARIFPKGQTLHLPASGGALPGYDQAMADYKRRVKSTSIVAANSAGPAKFKTAAPSDSTLLTAMLPTRKSRGEEALERQTLKQAVEEPPFFDLASITVPLPTLRAVASERALPVNTSQFVPSSSFKIALGTGTMRAPSATESSLTRAASTSTEWAIRDATLLKWALAPAKDLEQLILPAALGFSVASAEDAKRAPQDGSQLGEQKKAFDKERFWSDG